MSQHQEESGSKLTRSQDQQSWWSQRGAHWFLAGLLRPVCRMSGGGDHRWKQTHSPKRVWGNRSVKTVWATLTYRTHEEVHKTFYRWLMSVWRLWAKDVNLWFVVFFENLISGELCCVTNHMAHTFKASVLFPSSGFTQQGFLSVCLFVFLFFSIFVLCLLHRFQSLSQLVMNGGNLTLFYIIMQVVFFPSQ